MRFTQTLAASAAVVSLTSATTLIESKDDLKVVQHDIYRRQVTDPVGRDRRRRRSAGTVQSSLLNEGTLYLMNVSIGTPPQHFDLHLDTGSSDLWVNSQGSQLCTSRGNPCAVSGTYNANASSSYRYLNSEFNITYVDTSSSSGDYATDTVSFANITLENQEIGVGYVSSSDQGILGIGYPYDEAILIYDGGKPYVNVPQHLVQSGFINSQAYSLWLNDLAASTGSILFGGVSTGHYTGDLVTVPIIPEEGLYSELIIALTGVGYNGQAGSIASNQAIGALLDSGSSLMYLPSDIAQGIYRTLGAKFDTDDQVAIVNCNLQNNASTIDFTFSSATIRVSMSELIIVGGYDNGQPICIVGIQPGSQTVLGDTFLRSAYVVYDLHNNEISLAQTKFDSESTQIQAITNTTVPGATPASNPVSSVSAIRGGGHVNGGQITITATMGGAAPTPAVPYAAMLGAVGAGVLAVL